MGKTKILRIIARLNIGGPAIHTILLTEGLNNSRVESLLISGKVDNNEKDMMYLAKDKKINPIIIPYLERNINLIKDFAAFLMLYNTIKKENPHIVHTHTAKAGTLGRLAVLLYNFLNPKKKIKSVHTFHGHVLDGYFGKFKSALFIYIERILAKFTDKIIAVSKAVRNDLLSLKIGEANKITVIPLGLELEKFLGIPCRDNNSAINIGIVGRLVPIKNHHMFIEAARDMKYHSLLEEVKFFIIGDGELRRDLEKLAEELNIADMLIFKGWQKNIENVYKDLDIIALTSLNEGTPVSLIEAMAAGRAVVATDVGGVKDILGVVKQQMAYKDSLFGITERGVLVKPGNAKDFSSALIFLLRNSDIRLKMGRAGREFTQRKFNKNRLIKDLDNLYTDLLRVR